MDKKLLRQSITSYPIKHQYETNVDLIKSNEGEKKSITKNFLNNDRFFLWQ